MINIQSELEALYIDPLFINIRIPAPTLTVDDRLVEKLQAINEFITQYGRTPSNQGTFEEKRLARSLEALRNEDSSALKQLDIHNIL